MGDKTNIFRSGPLFLPNTANILYTQVGTPATGFLIKQIAITNVGEAVDQFNIWITQTDPGVTPPADNGSSISGWRNIQPGETINYFYNPGLRCVSNTYVVGQSDGTNTVTYLVIGESFLHDIWV